MKSTAFGIIVLVVLVVLMFGFVSQALAASGSIDAIIKDAQDGTIDGNWSAAQIRAALQYLKDNPIYTAYSDVGGVLDDYLASLQAPGAVGGQLAFTGSNIVLVLGLGAGLAASGVLLRRRARA